MLTIVDVRRYVFTGVAALCLVLSIQVPAGAVTEAIVTDPLSGVANWGYDPVSYFTQEEPLSGQPEYELEWGGVPWFFSSLANRDVFQKSPEIYAPQFGGYGAMGLARGYFSDGNPRIYALLGGRLFLFYSTGNRDAFLLEQRASYRKAVENWEFLSDQLARPSQ